ncbi:hypothetical protein [Loigolactobacillus coryniformis]|nr:hypothetical protein [Loigolactobacillus coryniformis]
MNKHKLDSESRVSRRREHRKMKFLQLMRILEFLAKLLDVLNNLLINLFS